MPGACCGQEPKWNRCHHLNGNPWVVSFKEQPRWVTSTFGAQDGKEIFNDIATLGSS
jgi:hypothetical protein